MEIAKEQRVGARYLACNTLGAKGVPELQDGIRKNDKHLIIHMDLQ
jgi:hypothetical protein